VRITNNMRQDQVLRNLQANMARLTEAQQQVSTGKRFTRAAEDPVGAAQVMRADRALRGIDQYRRNITAVRVRMDAEEAVLDQVGDMLTRASELAVAGATDSADATSRGAMAAEVDRMLEQMVHLGNTRVGNEYLFGGHQTGRPPFEPDASYVGDDGARRTEISDGYLLETNHTGRELLLDTGTIDALKRLRDALRAGGADAVRVVLPGVDTASTRIQVTLAETGARALQLENAEANMDAYEGSLAVRKELDQGITLEEATTRMLTVQNNLQAALASTSRVLTMSLTDYLR